MKTTWKYPLGGTFFVNSGKGSSLVGFLTQADFFFKEDLGWVWIYI